MQAGGRPLILSSVSVLAPAFYANAMLLLSCSPSFLHEPVYIRRCSSLLRCVWAVYFYWIGAIAKI
jgi:hypothetical protein